MPPITKRKYLRASLLELPEGKGGDSHIDTVDPEPAVIERQSRKLSASVLNKIMPKK